MHSFVQRQRQRESERESWFLILLPYRHQHTSSSCCFDCFVWLLHVTFFNTRSLSLSLSSAWRLYNYSLYTQQCKLINDEMALADDDKWHYFLRDFLCMKSYDVWDYLYVYIFPLQKVIRFVNWLITCKHLEIWQLSCHSHGRNCWSCFVPQINMRSFACAFISTIKKICDGMQNG